MKSQGMLISALVFAFVVALFAVINVESVQVNFLFAKPTIPLILVILASTLLGGAIVGLFGMLRQFKLQRSMKALEKRVQELTAGQVQTGQVEVDAPSAGEGSIADDVASEVQTVK